MIPGKFIWKPVVQKAVTGRARRFRMVPGEPRWPRNLVAPGLYLHVPFCKDLCPYCPYNRVEYEKSLFHAYTRAVMQEIDLYAPHLRGQPFTSLYVGGGTPTVHWPWLVSILDHVQRQLGRLPSICVELHPASMDNDCLRALKDAGVTSVSIGVESASDAILERIGRSHDRRTALDAVERALHLGFGSVNVDLMFALPGQSAADWQADVATLVDLGIDQLSTYPLFSFPYSDQGRERRLCEAARPPHAVVKGMLDFTDSHCESRGLARCAVWSWLRPGQPKFSSITRHHYIGFGPSAASMTGTDFYVNTFDVRAYAERIRGALPVAAVMPVDRRLEMAYWLYWRVYELDVRAADFRAVFGAEASLDAEFGYLLRPLVWARLLDRSLEGYRVTRPGAYWIHRLQNEYSLNYINRLWGTCRRTPWPEEVLL